MSDALPSAEALAKWFHDTHEALAPEYGYETRAETRVPWAELPENNRSLMVAVASKFIEEYGPLLSVSRAVWDAASWIWADWSIGKIEPARMEQLRQALIRYGDVTKAAKPVDPVMAPYEEAARIVRNGGGDKVHMETLAESILSLGKRRQKEQEAGLRSR